MLNFSISQKSKGFIFLGGGIIIQIIVSILAKFLYTGEGYEYSKPLFVTYFGDSLNMLYFIAVCFRNSRFMKTDFTEQDKQNIKQYTPFFTAAIISCILSTQSYGYYGGLCYTTIASSFIIINTSPIFVFLLSIWVLKHQFNWVKFMCVILSIFGFTLIALTDKEAEIKTAPYPLIGDFISLISAIFAAIYTILIKLWVPSHDNHDWTKLFAYMGLAVFILFWPFLILFDLTGIEKFEIPSLYVIFCIGIIALFASVIGDMLWARAVSLMDPLVFDLGMGAVIPIGVITGYFIEGTTYGIIYIVGALMVMASFVIITLMTEDDENDSKLIEENINELKSIAK